MSDLISRQAAIDALDVLCKEHRYKIPGKRETYSQYNEAWQDALDRAEGAIFNLPSAQPESAQWVQMLINPNLYKCSNCQIAWNKRLVFENEGYSNNILMRYCPRCGRKMKTEVDYE